MDGGEFQAFLAEPETRKFLRRKLKPVSAVFEHDPFQQLLRVSSKFSSLVEHLQSRSSTYTDQVDELLDCIEEVNRPNLFEHFHDALFKAGFHKLIDKLPRLRHGRPVGKAVPRFNRSRAVPPSPTVSSRGTIFDDVLQGRVDLFHSRIPREELDVWTVKNDNNYTVFRLAFEKKRWDIIDALLEYLECDQTSIQFWRQKLIELRRCSADLDLAFHGKSSQKFRLLQLAVQHWKDPVRRESNFVVFKLLIYSGCKLTKVGNDGRALENSTSTNILFMVYFGEGMVRFCEFATNYVTEGYGVAERNVLHFFVQWDCYQILEQLVDNRPQYQSFDFCKMIYTKDSCKQTPFSLAVSLQRLDCAILLLELLNDESVPLELVQVIMFKGNDIDSQTSRRHCPGWTKCIKRKICQTNKASISKREARQMHKLRCDMQGAAIHGASAVNNAYVVQFLLDHGSSARLEQLDDGKTPLQIAVERGCFETVRVLCQHDRGLIADSFRLFHPINLAILATQYAYSQPEECLKTANYFIEDLIRQNRLDLLTKTDNLKRHALHLISQSWPNELALSEQFTNEAIKLTKSLIDADGALLELTDSDGDRPIHYAVFFGLSELLKIFLGCGADFNEVSRSILVISVDPLFPTDSTSAGANCPLSFLDIILSFHADFTTDQLTNWDHCRLCLTRASASRCNQPSTSWWPSLDIEHLMFG